jgi:hypothetical protein
VSYVEKTELTHLNVYVLIISITLLTLVKNVLINVPNVLVLDLLVTHVPLTESVNQLVIVQLDTMISQKNQSVNHVLRNVLPALVLLIIVSSVLVTDFQNQLADVHLTTWIYTSLNVKCVPQDVVVVNMMFTIVLVAQVLEKVLQLVPVLIQLMKNLIIHVNHVTTLVLLVLITNIIV